MEINSRHFSSWYLGQPRGSTGGTLAARGAGAAAAACNFFFLAGAACNFFCRCLQLATNPSSSKQGSWKMRLQLQAPQKSLDAYSNCFGSSWYLNCNQPSSLPTIGGRLLSLFSQISIHATLFCWVEANIKKNLNLHNKSSKHWTVRCSAVMSCSYRWEGLAIRPPHFKKIFYTAAWSEKCCKMRKYGGKFVACCSVVEVVGETSLFYCEHHSRRSHLGRSFISQFLQIGAEQCRI